MAAACKNPLHDPKQTSESTVRIVTEQAPGGSVITREVHIVHARESVAHSVKLPAVSPVNTPVAFDCPDGCSVYV